MQVDALVPRYGTGMLRRFGWFFKVLGLGRVLSAVQFEENSMERVREAVQKGPVVYVLRHASAIDHLALNVVLNRRRLPLSVWSNGANSFWWQPVVDAWRDLWARLTARHGSPVESGWLAAQIQHGHVVTLFLEGSRMLGNDGDPIQSLLEAQQGSKRPIQVIPVVVQWTRGPRLNSIQDFLLGRQKAPGPLGQLRNAWFNSEGTTVQVGEPLDLAEFTRRADPEQAVVALRTVLRRYIKRESKIIQGPRILPYTQMKKIVLDSPGLRQLATTEAEKQGVSVERIRKKMDKEYRLIAARFRWWVVRSADVVLRPLWTRIYSGVDVRPEDIEAIRAAMRTGSAVVIPCHKSHFDYLLLSWVFYRHNLIVPHVIAGANLNIFLVNHFLRSVGGFFIKRSFQGEALHPAIFARYLRELIFQGYPIEFYIEGGRTRTGKLLPAKTGVLSILLDAAEVRPHDHEVTLLPVSLAYEQVAEQGAYVREAGGEEKRPENLGQVVKARSVLSRRYGRVYLRVGEPMACSDIVDSSPERPAWSERSDEQRRATLDLMGRQIVHRIGRVTVVLPTCLCAAALLAHSRRGIRDGELLERIVRFRSLLNRHDAMEAASLTQFDQSVRTALDRFARDGHIKPLEHEGQRVWDIQVDSRIELDFYKNQLVHFLLPAGVVVLCVRTLSTDTFDRSALIEPVTELVKVWDREFRFDPEQSIDSLVEEGIADLVAHGGLSAVGDQFQVADVSRLGEIHALFRSLVEAYRVVLAARSDMSGHSKKTLPRHLAKESDRFLATGLASRPEALSTLPMGTAIAAFVDQGAFTRDGDALGFDEERCAAIDALLAPMVE